LSFQDLGLACMARARMIEQLVRAAETQGAN
jgi:hypothetical protein